MPTPFTLVSCREPVRRAAKDELLRRVRDLETGALRAGLVTGALACLQDARFLDERTQVFYTEAAERGAEVVLFARGLQAYVAPGVRGVDLEDDDPLGDQWTVVLDGPAPVVFAAQDLLETAAHDDERMFAWAQSDDPELVRTVRDALLARLRSAALQA